MYFCSLPIRDKPFNSNEATPHTSGETKLYSYVISLDPLSSQVYVNLLIGIISLSLLQVYIKFSTGVHELCNLFKLGIGLVSISSYSRVRSRS